MLLFLHHFVVDHVGTQSSSASLAMLMRPRKAKPSAECQIIFKSILNMTPSLVGFFTNAKNGFGT